MPHAPPITGIITPHMVPLDTRVRVGRVRA